MPSAPRIALFGGTFDPPHLGHLLLAREAVAACGLDRVVFIPCPISPHKQEATAASPDDRCEMLRLSLGDQPWAEVSRAEIDRPPPSYSWQTAELHAASCPEARLFWILGQDQWEALETWARPDRLRELLTFIVFPRSGDSPLPRPGYRSHILEATHPASATAIREALRNGRPADDMLHPAVARFIRQHHLYTAS